MKKAVVDNSLSGHALDFAHGGAMIMLGNVSVGLNLAAVWFLGQRSPWAPVVIYGPLALAVPFMIRDNMSKVFFMCEVGSFSCPNI